MLKQLWAYIKSIPSSLLSLIKAAPGATWRYITGYPGRVLAGINALGVTVQTNARRWLTFSLLFLACTYLFLDVVGQLSDFIPAIPVSSNQVEKNLPALAASDMVDYRRSVVRIYNDKEFLCTGTVIGNNYVLTASHCLRDEDMVMRKDKLLVINDDTSIEVEATPVAINTRRDWGLLQGDFSKIPGAIVITKDLVIVPKVLSCGYPHGAHDVYCTILRPTTNDTFMVKTAGGDMLFPGMSGGPVFDENGQVIGVNVGAYPSVPYGGGAIYSPTIGVLASFHIGE